MTQSSFDFSDPTGALAAFRLSEEDLERVRQFGRYVDPKIDDLIGEFYAWLRDRPEYGQYFSDPAVLSRVQGLQREYWRTMLLAGVGDEFFERQRGVAHSHLRIRLPLESYLASMNFAFDWFGQSLQGWKLPSKQKMELLRALSRFFNLQAAVVVDCYHRVRLRTIGQQSRALIELSTPALRLWDQVVLMPLVGVIDTSRAAQVMEKLLEAIVAHQARVAILDVTGVPMIDTSVAGHLIKTVAATRMLGATLIVTGFSPESAQTLTKLDVDLSSIHTEGSLQAGIATALVLLGKRVVDEMRLDNDQTGPEEGAGQ